MNDLPLLVAVSGKLGSGKDYITENFVIPSLKRRGLSNISRMAFADHIKVVVSSEMDIPIEECLISNKTPEVRRKLQIKGTEEGREKHGEQIWVNTLERWVRLRQIRDNVEVVIITDCRFKNEVQWVEDNNGLVIRINAPERNGMALDKVCNSDMTIRKSIAEHKSETDLDSYEFKYYVNNDPSDIDSVEKNVQEILDDFF
jgi:hypothetical protein